MDADEPPVDESTATPESVVDDNVTAEAAVRHDEEALVDAQSVDNQSVDNQSTDEQTPAEFDERQYEESRQDEVADTQELDDSTDQTRER